VIRAFALTLCAALLLAFEPAVDGGHAAQAQSNNNDYTPLNSRIRRSTPLPTEPRNVWQSRPLTDVQRARSNSMIDQMARCIWSRSNEMGLDFLARTDFGFTDFSEIGIEQGDVAKIYPIETCLSRVAQNANNSVMLRFDAANMRRWYLQAAYFDRFDDGPTWIQPGLSVGERNLPISADRPEVIAALAFADCVVAQDPYGADFFFRTAPRSDEELEVIQSLVPAMSVCLPEGQELEIDRDAMRQWVGEGLWHISGNLVPADDISSESTD
tara:strand:- start:66367 stop:67176 length:810 start_codon:yes stop_codon:yes gene_type:complete